MFEDSDISAENNSFKTDSPGFSTLLDTYETKTDGDFTIPNT
jgi:hypothetical protein